MSTSSVSEIIKEAQIMQLLSHANIPTILGVQLEQKPFSIVLEFIGEQRSSSTVHELLQRKNTLDERTWIKISFNVADALAHMHKKGFLHGDLKSNNIVVSNGKGYLIDFGKACAITSPSAKKYQKNLPPYCKCCVDHRAVSRVMFTLWEQSWKKLEKGKTLQFFQT